MSTKNQMTIEDHAAIASGILEGTIERDPEFASDGSVTMFDAQTCMEAVRTITADIAEEIEMQQQSVENLAALVYVMEGAFMAGDGAPVPDLTAKALNSLGRSLDQISENLSNIMNRIYEKGK